MYGVFRFDHKSYKIRWEAGTLTIDEFDPGDTEYDFVNTISISMNDLRDIYRKADDLYRTLDVSVGDRVVLTDEFIAQGGALVSRHRNTIGVVEAVLTEWEKGDPICWDFHVKFGDNEHSSGVHWGDVRKI